MYETKPGNGGHGLEAYNVEDGKYAQITCLFDGKEINGWEELRDHILSTNPQYKQAYDADKNVATQFDDYVQDTIYPELLQGEVDRLNKLEESYVEFKDAKDAIDNLDKLFSDKLIDTLIENDILNSNTIKVNPLKQNYVVSTWAACIQMCRYKGNNRMKPIDRKYYDQVVNDSSLFLEQRTRKIYFGAVREYVEEAISSGKMVNLNRTMGISDEKVWQEVKRSYWDENSPLQSLLSHAGGVNCNFFGSCIYMSTGRHIYSSYQKHKIEGLVSPKDMKILFQERYYNLSPEISNFINRLSVNYASLKDKISNKLSSSGKCSKVQGERIFDSLYKQIMDGGERNFSGDSPDIGLCAMIMGYDAIVGESFHFDILNPNKVMVVKD